MTTWTIRDATGRPLAFHERHEGPDGKRFTWRRPSGEDGLNGTAPADLLYGAETIAGLPRGSAVVVTEGEKAADAVRDAGYHAVAFVCGAPSTPSDAVLRLLRRVVPIFSPDNDEVGQGLMSRAIAGLERVGGTDARWIDPPDDAPAGWDLADVDARTIGQLVGTARPIVLLPPEPEPEPEPETPPTWRTLADIPDDPPRPLILGMLEPDGPTLLYAAPGVGKGSTVSWMIRELQALGMRPVIFDAERREREWSRRVAGLGGDRSRVVYLTPADLGPRRAGRPLWETAPEIGRVIRASGGDVLFVDSILPAVGLGEDRLRSDPQVPFLFVAALEALAVPSGSVGHTPKGTPEGDPFGSMGWIAAYRFTWLGIRAEGDAHRVRWRPRKRNERGHVPGVLLTFAYGDDGRPCQVTRDDDDESTRDWLLAALLHGSRTVPQLADELLEDGEEPATDETIKRAQARLRQALHRMKREGWVLSDSATGKGTRWHLRTPEERP